jgi:hypothetical protein
MRYWLSQRVIWPLLEATYRAWGRRWITDDECRVIATLLVRLLLFRHKPTERHPA